jgi:uncharacterized protein
VKAEPAKLDIAHEVRELQKAFTQLGTPERAIHEQAYLKSSLKFLGVSVPQIRLAAKQTLKHHPDLDRATLGSLARELWANEFHELRSVAIAVLELRVQLLTKQEVPLLEQMMNESNTWAHLDWLAIGVFGKLLLREPALKSHLRVWAKSENFWLRRASLISQITAFRESKGDFELFTQLARPMLKEREFFIRKAIGWTLREVAKATPELCIEFVQENASELSGLSFREATRSLPPPQLARLQALRDLQLPVMKADFLTCYGPWAVVTGASSGIGEEFARQLAQRGLNLVLVARRQSRLEELKLQLQQTYSVNVDVFAADLGQRSELDRLAEHLTTMDIGLLVNNAGFGEKGTFDSISADQYQQMIAVNCQAPALLSHALIPHLKMRKHGGIIITASTAAFQATPFASAYAATKGFDLLLAEGLWYELNPHGVDVLALCPGATDTEGPRRTGVDPTRVPGNLMSVTPVVKLALDNLGISSIAIPGSLNKVSALATRLFPRWINTVVAGKLIQRVIQK